MKKPRVDQGKLPEHIAKVGVPRRGVIVSIFQPSSYLSKPTARPDILHVSAESAELPPDPIADPHLGIRVSAAFKRVPF